MKGIIAGQFAKAYITNYDKFRGVDFSADAARVDITRSPYAPNMVSDVGGVPQKRDGWRTVIIFPKEDGEEMPVNGIFSCYIDSVYNMLVHVGTKVYKIDNDGSYSTVIENINNGLSTAVYSVGKLYIFTGNEYLEYDGTSCTPVSGRIPIITIGRKPDGGGTAFEPINLISTATTDSFFIADTELDDTLYTSIVGADELDEDEKNPVSVSALLKGNVWETHTELEYHGDSGSEESYFQINEINGVLCVTLGPLWQSFLEDNMLFIDGEDNLRITVHKTRDGDADKVNKIKHAILYNGFIFGCGSERGTDYRSGFDDPTYWPADGYDQVGSTNTDIMGYLRVAGMLAVIKEDHHLEASVYLRNNIEDEDGKPIFTKQQAISGVGAISNYCFSSLLGDPLFLSRDGIFSIEINMLTGMHEANNKSFFVNNALKKEDGLNKAISVVWNGMYLLFVNNKVYVLDGKQYQPYSNESKARVYECYHWHNVPAISVHSDGESLFFGTDDGRLCKFNNDLGGLNRYADDGVAIDASWSTKADDDGNFAERKSMIKAGSGLLLKPFSKFSVEILVRSDRAFLSGSNTGGSFFDFNDIIFDDSFTFETLDSARVIPMRISTRRYCTLQITVRNAVPYEGFGVLGVVKKFYRSGVVR